MNNILILGGCGFVGINLALHLKTIGYNVVVMDNLVRRGVETNLPLLKARRIPFIHGDVRNVEDFNSIKIKPDVVLNCAAQPSAINYANPVFDITNNTIGTLNILEYCRLTNAGLIFWSTNKVYSQECCNDIPVKIIDGAYKWDTDSGSGFKIGKVGWDEVHGFNESLPIDGNNHSIYGVSKVMADLLVQEWSSAFNIPSIINRFSCLYGPFQWGKAEQGWMTWFAIALKLGLPITIYGFNGNQVRDYLFSEDICDLITKQIESISHFRGEVFNVGGGKNNVISINQAISYLENNHKMKFADIIIENKTRRADQNLYISDIRKVSLAFDWCPKVSLDDGYSKVMSWVKDNEDKLRVLNW